MHFCILITYFIFSGGHLYNFSISLQVLFIDNISLKVEHLIFIRVNIFLTFFLNVASCDSTRFHFISLKLFIDDGLIQGFHKQSEKEIERITIQIKRNNFCIRIKDGNSVKYTGFSVTNQIRTCIHNFNNNNDNLTIIFNSVSFWAGMTSRKHRIWHYWHTKCTKLDFPSIRM